MTLLSEKQLDALAPRQDFRNLPIGYITINRYTINKLLINNAA